MWRWTFILLAFFTCTVGARALRFHPGQTLGQTATDADFVFKGTVLSSTTAGTPPTKRYDERFFGSDDIFSEMLTRFKIVSVIKGDKGVSEITFRHFKDMTPPAQRRGIPQIAYDFEPGRTYLVFARSTGTAGVYGQIGIGVTFPGYKSDYGMMRCADDRPITAGTIQEIVWDELVLMLHDKTPADVQYAIAQLDQMSGGLGYPADYRYGIDFQRQDVSKLISSALNDPDPRIAQTAIAVIGSHNPYMEEYETGNWLATVGVVPLPALTRLPCTNPGGARYWQDLAEIADGKADAPTRSLAVAALGLACVPGIESHLDRWLTDPDAAVRASAALLLADYPRMTTRERIARLAADPDSGVVEAVARSLGYGRHEELADILGTLVRHPDAKVRKYAAMSLLTFRPTVPSVAAAMEANLDHPEFGGRFATALSGEHPGKFLDYLAKAAEGKMNRDNDWSGADPVVMAWDTLFKYIESQPDEIIHTQRYDKCLDALDHTQTDDERRRLSEFYRENGMTDRARNLGPASRN